MLFPLPATPGPSDCLFLSPSSSSSLAPGACPPSPHWQRGPAWPGLARSPAPWPQRCQPNAPIRRGRPFCRPHFLTLTWKVGTGPVSPTATRAQHCASHPGHFRNCCGRIGQVTAGGEGTHNTDGPQAHPPPPPAGLAAGWGPGASGSPDAVCRGRRSHPPQRRPPAPRWLLFPLRRVPRP